MDVKRESTATASVPLSNYDACSVATREVQLPTIGLWRFARDCVRGKLSGVRVWCKRRPDDKSDDIIDGRVQAVDWLFVATADKRAR